MTYTISIVILEASISLIYSSICSKRRPKLHLEVTHSIPKFTSEVLKSLDTKSLKSSLRQPLQEMKTSELYVELRFLGDFNSKDINMGPVEILKVLK